VHIYSVGRFQQDVLYFQNFIKFESTSLNVPDVFFTAKVILMHPLYRFISYIFIYYICLIVHLPHEINVLYQLDAAR